LDLDYTDIGEYIHENRTYHERTSVDGNRVKTEFRIELRGYSKCELRVKRSPDVG
jgi:hypothetical protein